MRRWALSLAVVLGWMDVDASLSGAWAQAQFADLAVTLPGPDDLALAVLALLGVGLVTWRRRRSQEF